MQFNSLNEKRWVIYFAIVAVLITLLPYWLGFSRQGLDWVFTGFVFGVEDGNSYIAKMLSGAYGHWLFQTPFTAYPQNGAFAFFPYLLLGKVASLPGMHTQLVVLFHLFRLLAGFLMILATYEFISIFIQDIKLRRLGLAVATLGGGLGWLSVFGLLKLWQNGLPLEFYSPETFGFLALFGLPHLAMARALLLWGLCAILQSESEDKPWIPAIKGGFFWLALGFFQPLTVVVGWVILGVYQTALILDELIFNKKEFDCCARCLGIKQAAIMVGISSPIPVYTFFAFSLDPFLKQWTDQNLILSPPIWDYLLAFGLILPLTIMGIRTIFLNRASKALLVIGWVFIFPLLAYMPYNLQRRLPEGVWVAFVVLAFVFLETLQNKNVQKWLKRALYLSFLTTLLVFWGAILAVWNPSYPLYRHENEAGVFKFLAEKVEDGDIVLAAYGTSNALPAWASVKTLIGHGPESVNLKEVQGKVEQFYREETDEEYRRKLIEEFDIRYVVWGPREKNIGGYNFTQDILFRAIYQVDDYWVFSVNTGDK